LYGKKKAVQKTLLMKTVFRDVKLNQFLPDVDVFPARLLPDAESNADVLLLTRIVISAANVD
jgi:hypothetical protein